MLLLFAARKYDNAFVQFLLGDWWISIPMILMSLTGVALVLWRVMLNSRAGTNMNQFLPAFQQTYEQQGPAAALELCRNDPGFIPNKLFVAGLENAPQGTAAMRRAMAGVIELEILPQLNFLLAWILAFAKIATMVGLFGTVVSMIGTFSAIGAETRGPAAGAAAPAAGEAPRGAAGHADEIGLALFATAVGLLTAIPLVFAHVLLKDWITNFETKMKIAAQKLLLIVQNVRPAGAA